MTYVPISYYFYYDTDIINWDDISFVYLGNRFMFYVDKDITNIRYSMELN